MLTTESILPAQWNSFRPEEVRLNYLALQRDLPANDLAALQMSRSFWARDTIREQVREAANADSNYALTAALNTIANANGIVSPAQANSLVSINSKLGDKESTELLALLLADYGDPAAVHELVRQMDRSGAATRRLGPPPVSGIHPVRRSRASDSDQWLKNTSINDFDLVDGNPDHIRIRGMELRSGDIGIVQLNKPGDGILEGFLTEQAIASHAVLYLTRRIRLANNTIALVPSAVEIYEGGWRSVPLTTVLSPSFSWYSEWVRPPNLPADIGEQLSDQLDRLGSLAFDFQGRKAPELGDFSDWEQPCATCTNFIRIPYEMAGISLPYPTTPVNPGAANNLTKLGVGSITSIYTPTNILIKSGFDHVGLVDNGAPDYTLAQAIVIGRPELQYTFGGVLCQSDLVVEKLPDWRSISKWRSAWANLLVNLGQTEHTIGRIARYVSNVDRATVPLSAPAATISFYLRCEFEARYIICSKVLPYVRSLIKEGLPTCSVEQLFNDMALADLVRSEFTKTALLKEGWFNYE